MRLQQLKVAKLHELLSQIEALEEIESSGERRLEQAELEKVERKDFVLSALAKMGAAPREPINRTDFLLRVHQATSVSDDAVPGLGMPISKGDISTMRVLEENARAGAKVREENERLRSQHEDLERERARRAQVLREQREQSRQAMQHQREATRGANNRRAQQMAVERAQRRNTHRERSKDWERHGRSIAMLESASRQRVLEEQRKAHEEKSITASSLNEELHSAAKARRAREAAQREELAARVRSHAESGARLSKQCAANAKWDLAQVVRAEHDVLHTRRYQGEIEHLAKAFAIKADRYGANEEARYQSAERRAELALKCKMEEAIAQQERQSMRESVLMDKRQTHDGVLASRQVSADGIAAEMLARAEEEGSAEGALAMLTRFFGFRRRGQGRRLTSNLMEVAL